MATDDLRNRDWLLLPGTLCTPDVFSGLLDTLGVPGARRRSVVLRYPSVEDYAAEVTDAARDAVLCGFSLGAIVAAHLADRLAAARLVLFGLNPHADDPEKAAGRHELERDVRAHGGAHALARRLPEPHGPDPGGVRAAILAMAEKASADIGAQTQLALTRGGALGALSRANCPVFCLTGGDDAMAPPTLGQAAAGAAPQGRFRLLPGLGHYALLEDPAACAEAVLALEAGPESEPRAPTARPSGQPRPATEA